MTLTTLHDILSAARQLPRTAQAELVETLLRESGPPIAERTAAPAETLGELSEAELQALAKAELASGRQRRLKTLLRKNELGKLSEREREELDQLLAENERIALLKAKAAFMLMRLRTGRLSRPKRFSFIAIGRTRQPDASVRLEETLESEIDRRSGWSLER